MGVVVSGDVDAWEGVTASVGRSGAAWVDVSVPTGRSGCSWGGASVTSGGLDDESWAGTGWVGTSLPRSVDP